MEMRQLNSDSIRVPDVHHTGRMRIDSDGAYALPGGLVPIFDIDVLDDEECEPDGVNDFVRALAPRDGLYF
jgi:hypothetical protein